MENQLLLLGAWGLGGQIEFFFFFFFWGGGQLESWGWGQSPPPPPQMTPLRVLLQFQIWLVNTHHNLFNCECHIT